MTEVSIFGIIWCLLIVFFFARNNIKYLIFLSIISFVFQSNYVFAIGCFTLNASVITCSALIVKYFITNQLNLRSNTVLNYGYLYAFYMIIISIVSPILFNGLEINSMSNIDYDHGIIRTFNLDLSVHNLTQPFSVLLYVLTATVIFNCRKKLSYYEIVTVFKVTYWMVLCIGVVHVVGMYLCETMLTLKELTHNEYHILGATYFDLYLNDNTSFARLMSTFYEPSYCGGYFAMCLCYFLNEKVLKNRYLYLISCILGLILNMSSTGLITSLFLLFISIVIYKKNFLICFVKKRVEIIVFCIICIILVLITSSEIRDLLYLMTVEKINSGSFEVRSIVNKFSWDVFKNSYGIGVGVNSLQVYSLPYALLSQIGIFGTLIYIRFIIVIYNKLNNNFNTNFLAKCCISGSIIASILSCSELNLCLFWMSIFYLMTTFKVN